MSWQIALGMLVIVQNISIILTKAASDRISKKSLGVFYQYLFCAIITVICAISTGKAQLNSTVLGIGAVGFLNCIGSYFQWKVSGLSLSKTALFFPLMEIVTIVLAVIFLGEKTFWTIPLICGIVICFSTMLYFRFPKEKEDKEKKVESSKWFTYAIAMVLIFGAAGFFIKFFSDKVPTETFLMGFYVGAFLGSFPLLIAEKQNPLNAPRKTILWTLPVAATITSAVFIIFWTYQLGGPVSFVIPVRGLSITLIPVLAGWFFFKERKGLTIHDGLVFLTGIMAVILILTR